MKSKRKPLVIKEVKFAPADDPASYRKIGEVFRLLLRELDKTASPPDVINTKGGQPK